MLNQNTFPEIQNQQPTVVVDCLGQEPWQVINATVDGYESILDPSEQQLISWLTIPLAVSIMQQRIIEPLIQKGANEGFQVTRTLYTADKLVEDITVAKKATKTGSSRPPFLHLAVDPTKEHAMTMIVPVTPSFKKNIIVEVGGELTKRGSGGHKHDQNPNRHVTVMAKANRKLSTSCAQQKLLVPGYEAFLGSTPETNAPINLKSLRSPARIAGGRGFTHL